MIARIWHGYTKPEHADAYEALLKPELLPGISKVPGYIGSYLLRKPTGTEVEFITIMLWDSIEAIRAIAGQTTKRRRSRGTLQLPGALRRPIRALRGHFDSRTGYAFQMIFKIPPASFMRVALQ